MHACNTELQKVSRLSRNQPLNGGSPAIYHQASIINKNVKNMGERWTKPRHPKLNRNNVVR